MRIFLLKAPFIINFFYYKRLFINELGDIGNFYQFNSVFKVVVSIKQLLIHNL